ncbi:replication protein RepA [Ancylobacter sp. VNQ12]|uniref:replication protein RepA n=1 Tax=Ancylobacter sp. VNQ12 TaxID=3400920 RepID=UPI003C1214B2
MERPDESLIKDADLRQELERHRQRTGGGNGIFFFEVRALARKQEERDAERTRRAAELAALPREKRRRAVVREVFESAAPSRTDIRHIHSVLAVCGLPHERQPLDVREYSREQGRMALDVSAGFLRDPNGRKFQQPLPFGPKARLVLMHLCSEAVQQKSAVIEIADTFTGFVRDMGFSTDGGKRGTLTAFKEQLNALAACSMRISAWDGNSVRTRNITPLEQVELWLSSDPDQRSLWPSTVTFSPQMFESLKQHAVPVNAHAIKAFAGSSRKLDLYFWLGWRLNNIETPLHISWDALKPQFGSGFGRDRDFKAKFAEELGHILEVFPKLPAKLTEEGLSLQPAGPDVLALPAPRPLKKR